MAKSPDAFRTISEVAEWLDVPTHVLRFWESRFTQVKPVKRAGGRRYYRPTDMELLGGIKRLLHDDGLTIRGVQKLLREEGVRHVASLAPSLDGRPDPRVATADNVVSLSGRDADPEAALSRWPFVDEEASPGGTAEKTGDKETATVATSDNVTPTEIEKPAVEVEALVDSPQTDAQDAASATPEAPREPAPEDATSTDAPSSPDPLAQTPIFDESAVYFAGPRVIAGLSRITRAQVRTHADQLEQALDRGLGLKRAMDRLDG